MLRAFLFSLLAFGVLLPASLAQAFVGREDIWIRDPFIFSDEDSETYTMVGTDILFGVQTYTTTDPDLRFWNNPQTAFTRPAGFWGAYDYWGGDLFEHDGSYYYFGSAAFVQGGWHSMYVLKGDSPAGPFAVHSSMTTPITNPSFSTSDGTLHIDDQGDPWLVYSQSRQVNSSTIIQDMRAVQMLPDLSGTIPATDYKLFDGSDFPDVTNFGNPPPGNTVWIAEGAEIYRTKTGELLMAWSGYTDINGAGRSDYAVTVARSSNGQLDGTWIQESDPLFAGDGAHGQIFEDLDGQLRLSLHTPNSFGIVPNRPTFIPIYDTGDSVTFTEPNQPASTIAYFRFEEGVPYNAVLDGVDVLDISGQGNHLRAFSPETAGQFSPSVPNTLITDTGRKNLLSYDNSQSPGGIFGTRDLLVQSGPIDNADYNQWTIEVSINLSQHIGGHHHTFVGRDGNGYNADGKLASLYFQVEPDDTLSFTYVDQQQEVNILNTNFTVNIDQWYNVSAVSDGSILSLYVDSGNGYMLIDQLILGAGNNALIDNQMPWTIGRGMYDGVAVDQFFGLIDEVRISNTALDPRDFLFATILPGDYNGDGLVNQADYTTWTSEFGQSVTPFYGADGNGDGVVDAADYAVWRDSLSSSAAIAVPEPTSITLLLLVGITCAGFMSKKRFAMSRCRPSSIFLMSLVLLFITVCASRTVFAINMPYSTGSIVVDGNLNDSAWSNASTYLYSGAGNNGLVAVKMMWDNTNAYFSFSVTDTDLWADTIADEVWNDDSVEFYLDLFNDGGTSWGPDDVAFLGDVGGDQLTWGGSQWWDPDNVLFQTSYNGTLNNSSDTDFGYSMELQIPWTELITPYTGRKLGITFGTSDDDAGGNREAWAGSAGVDPGNPNQYLDLTLTGGPSNPVPMYSNANLTVKNYNMGDPAVVLHNGTYYMVESPHENQNNQIIMFSSPNLVDWDYEGVVYETPNTQGGWNDGFIFAPDISIVDGEFYIGYSAQPTGPVTGHRVGIVHSTTIDGTYTETSTGPLFDTGNMSIDSHIEEINGESYIYWTQFQGSQGLYAAKLNSDFSGLATSPQHIVAPGAGEQLVEAPWTYEKDGTIYLFYSANPVDSENYRVGYATSTSPTGPFVKKGHILVKNTGVSGPGHNSIVESPDGKETFIVYHKWVDPDWVPGEFFQRDIAIDRLFFRDDGSVFTFGPTLDDHPLPSGVDGSFGVLQIKDPGFETNSLTGWDASSTAGSTSHIFPESNFDDAQNQEGQYHLSVFSEGTSEDALISQVLTGLDEGATYRITAWTRNSGRSLAMGVTPEIGAEVSLLADHIDYGREELDFTVALGADEATIWFNSPAGLDSSWIWIDAVEVFKIANAPSLPGDYNQDGFVDAADYTAWRDSLGTTGADLAADGNRDGTVNQLDYDLWKNNFGASALTSSVPEPTSALLVSLLSVTLGGWKGRRIKC